MMASASLIRLKCTAGGEYAQRRLPGKRSGGKIKGMLRLPLLSLTALLAFADTSTLRGKLVQPEGKPPSLETSAGKQIPLDGDNDTLRVLGDKRLAGADLELKGRQEDGRFVVDPIHTKAIHVHRDGKAHIVTYWCDTCAIRTYVPGLCVCCREETELDLREDQ